MFLFGLGCIWALQGFEMLHRPTESFILGQRHWPLWCGSMILAGSTLMWLATKRQRG
jgi:hypothetical protein